MNVVIIPADSGACGHYRLAWPGLAVARENPDWTVQVIRSESVQMRLKRSLTGAESFEVRGLPPLDRVDVVVMQRVGTEKGVHLVRHLQSHGVAVVVDNDDAMWAIEKDNASWRAWNRGPYHWRYADEATRLADLATVTTPYLAKRYGSHGRVEVLPNFVPAAAVISPSALEQVHERESVTVGWAGTLRSHPRDLPEAHPAVHIAYNLGARVSVLGDGKGVADAWGLPSSAVAVHEPVSLNKYHMALDVFDVGLVPLVDSPFNRGKSWLKALEFAARGIPTIASPTPANRALSEWLPGLFIAERPPLAVAAMTRLLKDRGRRHALAMEQRAAVEAHFTVERGAVRWAKAWQRAATRREGMSA